MVLKTAPSNAVTLRISPLGLSAAHCALHPNGLSVKYWVN